MGMVYKWKEGSHVTVDAQIAGEELERIRTFRNGRLDPESVVDASRDPGAPLHPEFEWNDKRAADKWRLDQASYLIRHIGVLIESGSDEASPVRAFVSVVRGSDTSYTSVCHALADPDLRSQVLLKALGELEAWRRRYAELVELATVFASVDQARSAIEGS